MRMHSLLRRLTLISSMLNLIFSLTVAFACIYPFYRFYGQERWREIQNAIRSDSNYLPEYLTNLNELAMLVSSRTRFRDITIQFAEGKMAGEDYRAEATKIFDETVSATPKIIGIARVGPDGSIYAQSGVLPPELKIMADNRSFRMLTERISGKLHLLLVSPALSDQNVQIATDIIVLSPEVLEKMAMKFISASHLFNSVSIVGRDSKGVSEICSVNKGREAKNISAMFFSSEFSKEISEISDGTIKYTRKFDCYYFLTGIYSETDSGIYLLTTVPEEFFSIFSEEKIYLIILLVLSLSLVSYVLLSELMKPLEVKIQNHIMEISSLNSRLSKEIKDHQRTETLLRGSEQKFRIFMDNIPGIVFVKDPAGRYAFVNNFIGRSGLDDPEKWIGKTDEELWPEKKKSKAESYDQKALSQSQSVNTIDIINFGGIPKRFITYRFPIVSEDKENFSGGISFDISDILRMENELAKEKERLSLTLLSISDGVIVTDRDWKIKIINNSALDITGWDFDDITGRDTRDVFRLFSVSDGSPITLEDILRHAPGGARGEKRSFELVTKTGERKIIEDGLSEIRDPEGETIGFVIVFRDITLMSKIQDNLRMVQKMESIGLLAGGIAHDFNNILQGVIGNIGLARLISKKTPELDDILQDAEIAASRAKELTRRLITFAKGGTPEVSICSVRRLLADTLEINLAGSNIKFCKSIPDEIWGVEVDYSQMTQVFSNIITNARQAMEDGGELIVDAANITVPEHNDRKLPPGPYVAINFRNNGEPIPKELRHKIFDPFFTTRKGCSGLGLSIAFSIVNQHRGFISVEDNIPRGTVFTIMLPATGMSVLEAEPEKHIPPPLPLKSKKAKKILVMDDEESIRKLTTAILEKAGHKVFTTSRGEETVEIFRAAVESDQKFDLVILDLTIVGGMGGRETLEQLRKICPDVVAAVSTGYSDDSIIAEHEKHGFKYRLPKPYFMQELVHFIDSIP